MNSIEYFKLNTIISLMIMFILHLSFFIFNEEKKSFYFLFLWRFLYIIQYFEDFLDLLILLEVHTLNDNTNTQ